jgi:hypothetical protein
MKIYLDNCCFNRPFDDQTQIRIRLETEAKLDIQNRIRSGNIELAWSYILDFENSKNPFPERKNRILSWKRIASEDIRETPDLLVAAEMAASKGIKPLDSLHIACASMANCHFFLTTDDGILKKVETFRKLRIVDPIEFMKGIKS